MFQLQKWNVKEKECEIQIKKDPFMRTMELHTPYKVLRQDDHGNKFTVEEDLTYQRALELVTMYEERGHKQMYWTEPQDKDYKDNR